MIPNQKSKLKKNQIIKFKFSLLFFFLILFLILGYKLVEKDKNFNEATSIENLSKEEPNGNIQILSPSKEHKDLGDIESIIEYGSNGLVGVHYPVFGKSNIDSISKELVTEYIKKFKSELSNDTVKSELSIDYESYAAPNNTISVLFNILENTSFLAHPHINIITKTYDLSNDKEIKLDSIMVGEYLEYISKLSKNYFLLNETYKEHTTSSVFYEGIFPSKENYSNFILKKNKIVFIFEKYQLFSGVFGMPSFEIPYSYLKDYINPNLYKIFAEEENLSKIDLNSDETIPDLIVQKRVVDPNKPMIALTFDDGPNKATTIPILDTLKKYSCVGTFFVLGNRVPNNANILKRMLVEGSEIGNHSYNHKDLTKLSTKELTEQIIKTQDAVIDFTGYKPKFLRPTYGAYDSNLKSKAGMPLILWSIDTLDWKSKDSIKVTDHVLENVKDKDIILMHDIYESTAEAVKLLVPELLDMGYQLVTISELFESRNETLKDGHIYNHMYNK